MQMLPTMMNNLITMEPMQEASSDMPMNTLQQQQINMPKSMMMD